MEPSIAPINPRENAACTDCDGPLGGNKLRCPPCVRAAEIAVQEANGGTVRPSDIARVRERLA